jgi:hypothetical protein
MRREAEQAHRYFQLATGETVGDEGPEDSGGDSTAGEIEAFKLVRAQTIALLGKLDPSAWGHGAVDPQFGNLTIEQAALRLIADEEEALDRLAEIRRALGR